MEPQRNEPAALSFADSIILDGIAAGRSDAEIAVKLGITTVDVKSRIVRLQRISGATSRGALNSWDRTVAPQFLRPGPPDSGTNAEPRKNIPRRRLATTVSAIVAISLIIYRVASLSDAVAPTEARVENEAPPAAAGASTIDPRPMDVLPGVTLPEGLLLYIVRGCEGCPAPPTLTRVVRDRAGTVHESEIFSTVSGSGDRVLGAWAANDGSTLVATVCEGGDCNGTEARSRVYASTDSGVTWTLAGSVKGAAMPIGVTAPGRPLVSVSRPNLAPRQYEVYDGRARNDTSHRPPGGIGEQLLLASLDPSVAEAVNSVRTRDGGTMVYTWNPGTDAARPRNVSTLVGLASPSGLPLGTFRYEGATVTAGAWLDETRMVATMRLTPGPDLPATAAATGRYLPVVLDFEAGSATPITTGWQGKDYGGSTADVVGAVEGEFLVVEGTDDTCLLLRALPDSIALPVACTQPGVVLDLREVRDVDGVTWLRLRTPANADGWVATDANCSSDAAVAPATACLPAASSSNTDSAAALSQ